MAEQIVVFTWGYQGRQLSELEARIGELGIDKVVDVRGNPYSRNPAWQKENLEKFLGERYCWIGWLGDAHYAEGGDPRLRNAKRGMSEVDRLIAGGVRRLLLLCYERDWRVCHRNQVADMIADKHAAQVVHLI